MNSLVINKSKKAINVVFSDAKMIVFLEDGRELSNSSRMVYFVSSLCSCPRLRNATSKQLQKWRFIGNGEGIHWDEIDEDIAVENLLE
ncbi:MAG TPA: DUF2442 domain-containing protein [Flavobacterium sp.]|nr:DUF2442 domain-containing protein [Flavobacterium sp.]